MLNKILIVVFSVVLLAIIGALIYVKQQPAVGESFTDFYILGRNKDASEYPTELTLGEEGRVTLVVENHEKRAASYRVEVLLGDRIIKTDDNILLDDGQKWESDILFRPSVTGVRQPLRFLLFMDGGEQVYRSLTLWVDVK
ncbi:MAG: DUF1616 domain-containing protein [Chloroflexi bacterium]|nr:DUF1616 domain-containing protein [Chloroflexota bacterium]